MEVLYIWIKGNDLKIYGDSNWYGRKHNGRDKVACQFSIIIWIIIAKLVPQCGSRNLNFLS